MHNLDSQVADTVAHKTMSKYGWCIPIHDAFLISPAAAQDVRKWYAEELTKIYHNRKSILANYFRSIGITSAAQDQWEKVMDKVEEYDNPEQFEASSMALK